jgi:hypothetical protein
MSKDVKQDGGPAFPSVVRFDRGSFDPILGRQLAENEQSQHAWQGMSLRDWLAGQALAGALACEDIHTPIQKEPGETDEAAVRRYATRRAEFAYWQADAMLAARAKP